MSVLEFISSLKWPLLILILTAFSWWRFKKNPQLGNHLRTVLEGRSVRVSIAGQEMELSHVVEAAAVAASSDAELAHTAHVNDLGQEVDTVQLRRAAVEDLMTHAAHWGWSAAQLGFETPPNPAIQWNEQGQPEIGFASGTLDRARHQAILRRLSRIHPAGPGPGAHN
ncbi:hypothetical protein ACWCP6_18005 [Streptomyces sp. NPDC002004]